MSENEIRYFVVERSALGYYGHEQESDTLSEAVQGFDVGTLPDLVVIKGIVLSYEPAFQDIPLTIGDDKHEKEKAE